MIFNFNDFFVLILVLVNYNNPGKNNVLLQECHLNIKLQNPLSIYLFKNMFN